MRRILLFTLSLFCGLMAAFAAAQPGNGDASAWARSIVTIEVARKQFDYYQPWGRRTVRAQKTGLVLNDREILTSADQLFDRTLVRLQKNGRGRWFVGDVTWVDYQANLAIVTTKETDFWNELKPVKLGTKIDPNTPLQIVRWREGNLETRRAEFSQFAVREGQLSGLSHVTMEVASDIQSAGWAEPIINDSQVVGIITSQDGRECNATPMAFIEPILKARAAGSYKGLGYYHFFWQPSQNPALQARLELPGAARGVVVIHVPNRPDAGDSVLRKEDIILNIDGFDIDVEGDYQDPMFGYLMLENLSSRGKWAGDVSTIKIWRDGKEMEVKYTIPKFDYDNALVPGATYDKEPEYLIVGGLVFQPLTDSYLQAWGAEWKRRSPFRLFYYREQEKTPEQPSLVILSQVLPDPYNTGYTDNRWIVLSKINGQRIATLPDIQEALKKPSGQFHVIEFANGETLQRLVLAAGSEEQAATQRVLERYGIEKGFYFAPGKGK